MLLDGSYEVQGTWHGPAPVDTDRCARVHRTLKRIVKARGALDASEAAALREAQDVRLWRAYGYASLLEYMEREMGYAPRTALERLRVAKAIEELPAIGEAMTQGDLSFSAAREITRVATPENENEWLAASADKNLRQLEELVSGHARGDRPTDPIDRSLRRKKRVMNLKPETDALFQQVREILGKERGEHLDDDAVIAAMCRQVLDGGGGPERSRAPYQVAVTVCEQCKRGWQDGAGVTVQMSPPAVERALCDAQMIGSLDDDATPRATQTIPPATRRKVLRRDHHRCRVPGCRSVRNLDVHHREPRAKGGTHKLPNLLTLCELCRARHNSHYAGYVIMPGRAATSTVMQALDPA